MKLIIGEQSWVSLSSRLTTALSTFCEMEQQRKCTLRSTIGGGKVDQVNDHTYFFTALNLGILAYLQFVINEDLSMQFFESNIVSHCKEQLQKLVSLEDIHNKLKLFWDHWCDPKQQVTNWKRIYVLGVRGLPRLPNDKARWVQDRALGLKEYFGSKRTRWQHKTSSVKSAAIRKVKNRAATSRAERKATVVPRKRSTLADARTKNNKRKSNPADDVSRSHLQCMRIPLTRSIIASSVEPDI